MAALVQKEEPVYYDMMSKHQKIAALLVLIGEEAGGEILKMLDAKDVEEVASEMTKLPMREIMQLHVGSVVELDQNADAPVDLYVNSKLIARGEVVVLEDQYGIKITELIGSPKPS